MEYRTIQKKEVSGQSLFEVVIAIGVAAMILVGAVSLSTTSLRNTNFSKNNALATKYAQEGSEFIRQKRDEGWDTYMTNYTVVSGTLYLDGSLGNSNALIDGVFSRTIATECKYYNTVTGGVPGAVPCGSGSTANIVDSFVVVSWTDSQGTHNVNNVTTLTKWRLQ